MACCRMSAIGGKADMAGSLAMSAFDPERTQGPRNNWLGICLICINFDRGLLGARRFGIKQEMATLRRHPAPRP